MKTFAVTALVVLCIFQFGNAAETVVGVLKKVESLKSATKTAADVVKTYAVNYAVEINEAIENAENKFNNRLEEEIKSTLAEIKEKTNTKPACYEAAKSRFDELKATSKSHVEECTVKTEEGAPDVDEVFDKILNTLSHVKKFNGFVENLEKQANSENPNLAKLSKKTSAAEATFKILEFSIDTVMKSGARAYDSVEKHANKCTEKEFDDAHVSSLVIKENALNCVGQ